MIKNNFYVVVCLSLSLALIGCVDDTSDASDRSSNQGGNSGSSLPSGPAYEVNGTVTDGSRAGPVQGSAEMSVAGQNYGQVVDGIFTVRLYSFENGLIVFTVDTNQVTAPGSYTIDGSPNSIGIFNWAFESNTSVPLRGTGGTITINACPNDTGAHVTGRFNDVALTDSGRFSGTFAATVVESDGSAQCTS